eukprot:4232869-Alexandrium_andersonii.AAC.1
MKCVWLAMRTVGSGHPAALGPRSWLLLERGISDVLSALGVSFRLGMGSHICLPWLSGGFRAEA